jgi:hypothetical protein
VKAEAVAHRDCPIPIFHREGRLFLGLSWTRLCLFNQWTDCPVQTSPRFPTQQLLELLAQCLKLPNLFVDIVNRMAGQLLHLFTGLLTSPRQI